MFKVQDKIVESTGTISEIREPCKRFIGKKVIFFSLFLISKNLGGDKKKR